MIPRPPLTRFGDLKHFEIHSENWLLAAIVPGHGGPIRTSYNSGSPSMFHFHCSQNFSEFTSHGLVAPWYTSSHCTFLGSYFWKECSFWAGAMFGMITHCGDGCHRLKDVDYDILDSKVNSWLFSHQPRHTPKMKHVATISATTSHDEVTNMSMMNLHRSASVRNQTDYYQHFSQLIKNGG